MNAIKACYRKLHKYKYQLMSDFEVEIKHAFEEDLNLPFIAMSQKGKLTVKKGYAWDGPSGPTIDTRNFMRGALVHDVLYQLMRDKVLDSEKDRKYADDLLKEMCIEDGMSKIRAWYVHKAVRLCGKKHATPQSAKAETIVCVPR